MDDTNDVTELDMRYRVTRRKRALRQLTMQEVLEYERSEYYPKICIRLDKAEEELEHYLLERFLKNNWRKQKGGDDMKINSSYILAVLAGVMLAGFLPHEEWVVGWAGVLALITLVVAGVRDAEWTKGLDWLFRP